LPQRLGILNHDEVPRLRVHATCRQATGLQHPAQHIVWHGPILILADRLHRADGFEDFH